MAAKQVIATAVLATVVLSLAGCSHLQLYPYERPVRVALAVADLDGQPVAGAAVWIGDVLQAQRTAAEFTPLGSEFPPDFVGWPANFVSDTIYVRINFQGDEDEVTLLVTRSGYEIGERRFFVPDLNEPLYFRQAVILEPRPNPAGGER